MRTIKIGELYKGDYFQGLGSEQINSMQREEEKSTGGEKMDKNAECCLDMEVDDDIKPYFPGAKVDE